MPNIKSAKKRVLVNAKKAEQNKAIRSAVKTEIKKIELLIKENKIEEAVKALPCAFSAIDSACSKNIFHANNCANKKAKLAKKVDEACKKAGVAVTEVAPVKKEEVLEVAEKEVAPAKEEVVEKPAAKKTTAKKTTSTTKKTTTAKKTTKKADAE